MSGKSIFDKLWERHVITGEEGEPQLMYVDQHYIHEVTSPQAFQGLRDADRKVRRPELTFGTTDHNVPTVDIFNIRDLISKIKLILLQETLKNLVLTQQHMEVNVKGLFIWLVRKQDAVNLANLLSAGTAIRRHMALLELLLLVLEHQKWSMCLRHNAFGK